MTSERGGRSDALLTSDEVATLFRVGRKTVSKWAAVGRVRSIRTPGGHRRYWRSDIEALLEGDDQDVDQDS